MANHEDMLIAVDIGLAKVELPEGEWHEAVVGQGFAEIVNNRVTLIVETAEKPEDIDLAGRKNRRSGPRSSSARNRASRSTIILRRLSPGP